MIGLDSYGLPTSAGPAPSSRTLDRAGCAAEAAVSRRQRGLETECPRKLGRVTPQRCAALYRIGMSPCVSTLMGRCSLGMIEDQRQPKGDDMSEKNRWARYTEDSQESTSGLPDNLDRPFTIAGLTFIPPITESSAPPLVTIRKGHSIVFNQSAADRYHLREYTHARPIMDQNGTTLGIKFYAKPHKGARLVQKPSATGCQMSDQPFIKSIPSLVGKKATLEPTEWDGFFVAKFDGEAA